MNVKLHCPEDIQRLREISRKELNAKQRDRYRAVLLALESQTTEAIMRILDRSKNFVQRWVSTTPLRPTPPVHVGTVRQVVDVSAGQIP